MARTRVRLGRICLVVGLALGGATLAGRALAGTDAPVLERYVVRPGDTLWEIADARVGEGQDPRRMVEAIRIASELPDASLEPGSVLLLPSD